ncbi:hypothetical protein FVE85_9731 [Porphyridium purpureum]|uniref:Uncharacterized protein n=1 Tax=Porphyridium purpureum TaxID=35688 RepID=A0A5J4YLV5_PORPP|nr:hypothetical protein FVE85_9731 [Porphyridium purpureum]|eukprot:POR9886..scf246_12
MKGTVAVKAARLYIRKVALRSVDAEAADSGQSPAQWYPVRRMMRTLHESSTHIQIPWRTTRPGYCLLGGSRGASCTTNQFAQVRGNAAQWMDGYA